MASYPWFVSARRVLGTVFPGDKTPYRIADLGCLEGGYSVEFARLGFQVLGLDVRESNIAACEYVKSRTSLPNLQFVRDDVWNIANHGKFDAVFCCGLLYHLDKPRQFLDLLGTITARALIVQTHFSTAPPAPPPSRLPRFLRGIAAAAPKSEHRESGKFNLSTMSENEEIPGRWYREFAGDADHAKRENSRWSSWDNRLSFWIQREYLLQAISDSGFDMVFEQFDNFAPNIAEAMTAGTYKTDTRGTFVGIKTVSE